jgi:hypothetical protein
VVDETAYMCGDFNKARIVDAARTGRSKMTSVTTVPGCRNQDDDPLGKIACFQMAERGYRTMKGVEPTVYGSGITSKGHHRVSGPRLLVVKPIATSTRSLPDCGGVRLFGSSRSTACYRRASTPAVGTANETRELDWATVGSTIGPIGSGLAACLKGWYDLRAHRNPV